MAKEPKACDGCNRLLDALEEVQRFVKVIADEAGDPETPLADVLEHISDVLRAEDTMVV